MQRLFITCIISMIITSASAQDGRFFYDADGNPIGVSSYGDPYSLDNFDDFRSPKTGRIVAPRRQTRNLDASTDPFGEMSGHLLGDE